MRVKGEFVLRQIGGDYILVPVGASAMEINGMITLNEIGVTIWQKLEKECSYEEVLESILEEYEVGEDRAKEDLDAFLTQMRDAGLLME